MTIEIGSIIKAKYARGSDLGYFKVEELVKLKKYWYGNNGETVDGVICVLALHEDGTPVKSKNLKRREYRLSEIYEITSGLLKTRMDNSVAKQKASVTELEDEWKRIIKNLFPSSEEAACLNQGLKVDDNRDEFFDTLDGGGLLRGRE